MHCKTRTLPLSLSTARDQLFHGGTTGDEETGCGRVGFLSLAACPRLVQVQLARAVSAFVIGWRLCVWHDVARKRRAWLPRDRKRGEPYPVCLGAELKSPCSSWSGHT